MRISLYRREGSTNWWVRYRDEDGALRRQSTGETNEEAARRIANRIEEKLIKAAASKTYDDSDVNEQSSREAYSSPRDVFAQIAGVETLMISAMNYQAQAQEILAKRISMLLRHLAERMQTLEDRLDFESEEKERPPLGCKPATLPLRYIRP